MVRRERVTRKHREIIIRSVPDSKLLLVVVEGKEFVAGIKILIVFAMTSLDLSVVSGCIWLNELVMNVELL